MWLLFLFIVIVLISLMVNGFIPTLIVVLIGFVIGGVIGYSRYKNQKPDLLALKGKTLSILISSHTDEA